jgi:hypothetical protein
LSFTTCDIVRSPSRKIFWESEKSFFLAQRPCILSPIDQKWRKHVETNPNHVLYEVNFRRPEVS